MYEDDDPVPLNPQEAHEFLEKNPKALLVDIRSSMEYLFVGHAIGSIHIPWIDEPNWEVNPNFVKQITELCERKDEAAPQDIPLILICRSGKRTLDAGDLLIAHGFSNVMHVDEGFEGDKDENNHRGTLGGWRFRGLPWEQC